MVTQQPKPSYICPRCKVWVGPVFQNPDVLDTQANDNDRIVWWHRDCYDLELSDPLETTEASA